MLLSPRDYARSRRWWNGTVPLSRFSRLVSEFGNQEAQVDVELQFFRDGNRRIWMKGSANVKGAMLCKQCLNHVDTTLEAEIDACLMTPEEITKDVSVNFDVVEYEDSPVSIVDLVEDDLIMSIPWRACLDESNCAGGFSSDQLHDEAIEIETTKPFADLRDLIDKKSEET